MTQSSQSTAQIRMIATDIDGTMLRTDGTLSDRTLRALHHANSVGIHVVPTTGRPHMVAEDVIEALELHNYWIFANGAITKHLDRGETIRAHWIEPAVAQGLVVEMRAAYPGAKFALELEADVSYEPGFENLVPVKPRVQPIEDVLDGFHGRVQKVIVFHEGMTLDELYVASIDAVGDHGVVNYTGLNFIEIGAEQVTKAVAVEALCADLGIGQDEVVSFGDNHNDVSMLEWCGHSYAMANASEDAKEAAKGLIGHTDEDGLAIKIEEIVAARESASEGDTSKGA